MEDRVFKQSITRFGSILRPDSITITDTMFIWGKRDKNLISKDSKSFELHKITSVEIDSSLWGTDMIIRTLAGDKLKVEKFTLADAEEIKSLIEERQQLHSTPTHSSNSSSDTTSSKSKVDELRELKELFDDGVIDEDDYEKLKQQIINK